MGEIPLLGATIQHPDASAFSQIWTVAASHEVLTTAIIVGLATGWLTYHATLISMSDGARDIDVYEILLSSEEYRNEDDDFRTFEEHGGSGTPVYKHDE